MATVTTLLGSFNDGIATVSYTYDDSSLLITSVILANNGVRGTLQVVLSQSGVAKYTRNVAVAVGTTTDVVSGLGVHMVQVTGKGGVQRLTLPFDVSLSLSSS